MPPTAPEDFASVTAGLIMIAIIVSVLVLPPVYVMIRRSRDGKPLIQSSDRQWIILGVFLPALLAWFAFSETVAGLLRLDPETVRFLGLLLFLAGVTVWVVINARKAIKRARESERGSDRTPNS